MGFLQKLLSYRRICIQCHNHPDPDTIASAFGVYSYLKNKGVDAFIVYGGPNPIEKSNLHMMLQECEIPLEYTHEPKGFDLLLLMDCQYGQGNVEWFAAKETAIIDHHIRMVEEKELYLIKSEYQSCSTIVWELLKEEGFSFENEKLAVALLYGLYTDTSGFADLYHVVDSDMRRELFADQQLFDQLTKTNMTIAELMIASEAMHNQYLDIERRFAIVEALSCEQSVLGIIGDFVIQVDIVWLSFTYTEVGNGYRISIRTCRKGLPANKIAEYICDGIGNGGGHLRKAGGYIQADKMRQKYDGKRIFDVVKMLLRQYIDQNT